MNAVFFQRPLISGTGDDTHVCIKFIYKESGLVVVPLWLSQTVCSIGSFLTSQIGSCLRQGPWDVMKRHSRGKIVKASHDGGWCMIFGQTPAFECFIHVYTCVFMPLPDK